MALSPTDLALGAGFDDIQLAAIKKAEDDIDAQLPRHRDGKILLSSFSVAVQGHLRSYSDELARRYKQAGWKGFCIASMPDGSTDIRGEANYATYVVLTA